MSSDVPPRSRDHVGAPDAPDPPVAIVGIGALFPGSTTAQGFWGDIVAGRNRITEVPATHWRIEDYFNPDPAAPDKIYARRGAFLPAIDFSPLHFGIPPASLPAIDTAQLLALVIAERVITDMASRAFAGVDRDRIGVILGVASATELVTEMVGRLQRPRWERELRASGLAESDVQRVSGAATERYVPWQESTFPGLLGNVVSGRIANRLDLGGSNYVVDAACGSSLAAVESALNELYLRRADLVITGGVDALNDVLMFMCFSKVGALSRTGNCRPFAADADGTLLGEGVGMFALKRLADAERDGDHVYAVIRGLGSSSDRRALSIYAPRPEGQAKALTRAYARAGYGPECVELVEGHGTGTRAGDLAEVEALRRVFDRTGRRTQWCALGSVKSQIGHTKAAAGAAGLFKVAMALHHRILPPTINVERPDPRLALDESPFYLNTRARPWVKAPGEPRRASVSSFGFGGTNFHVTLEEYDGPASRAPRLRTMPSELLLVSAADRDGLADACRAYARRLAEPDTALDAIARETHQTFSPHAAERVALVVADAGEGGRGLERAAAALVATSADDQPGVYHGHGEPSGKIAFLFPGQGSQYVGMGGDLAMHFDGVRQIWDQAAGLERREPGGPARYVFPPPSFDAEGIDAQEHALRATERAQPAIATASFAATALLRQLGLTPALMAGHSLGELTALATAGVFDVDSLVAAACARGRAMAEAAQGRSSTMTAALAARERVEEIIRTHGHGVVVANHNGPEQTVISGENAAIEVAETALAATGIRYRRLPVAAAFHSPLFAEAGASFEKFLGARRLRPPALPVYSHVTAAPYASDVAAVPAQLGRAVVSPVRFVEQIEALYRDGARVFVEPGPDNVLTRLVGECLGDRRHVAVALDRRGVHGVTSLWRALGALAAAGVPFDLAPLWEGQVVSSDYARPVDATTVRICGANFGKRYPPAGDDGDMPPPPARTVDTATLMPSPPPPIHRGAPAADAEIRMSPPAATPTATAAAGDARGDAWLDAFSALQQQTAAAHADFQRLLAERHAAFLRASTEGLRQLAALAATGPLDAAQLDALVEAVEPRATEARAAARAMTGAGDIDELMSPPLDRAAPTVAPLPAFPSVASGAPSSRSDVLLDIVAEKTGYPREALDLAMDLESDLGIDSIKRVEILAAATERIPNLPRLQTDRLAAMRTLAQIAAYIDSATGGAGSAATASTSGGAQTPPPLVSTLVKSTSTAPSPSRSGLLLDIVADKTGYPREALDLGMDLESDLGIDSIKRVEILAAATERIPNLPRLQTDRLAAMRTLAQIAAYIDSATDSAGSPAATASSPSDSRTTAPSQTRGESRFRSPALIERRVPTLHDTPPSGFAVIDLWDGESLSIVGDPGGIGRVLAARLAREGIKAEVVETVSPRARRIVVIGTPTADSTEAALAIDRAALSTVASRARLWEQTDGLLVTVERDDRAGDYSAVWLGGLTVVCRTARVELPRLTAKAITLDGAFPSADLIARAIVDELIAGGTETEVHLNADGRRRRPGVEVRPIIPGDLPLDRGAVVVVSGGGRGITAEAAIALAHQIKLRFLLLGRTPLIDEPSSFRGVTDVTELSRLALEDARARGEACSPADVRVAVARIVAAREVTNTLARVRAAGSEVRYVAIDVADARAVAGALEDARRAWGPIAGMIHGAGALADARLRDKTEAHVERVFAPKLVGLANLLAATAADPLRLICTFSSVAAHVGNAGQADYAMANSILERVTAAEAARRGPSCQVRALAWGPWDAGMVTPHLREKFAREGVSLIDPQVGSAAFVRELGDRGAETTVLLTADAPSGRPWQPAQEGTLVVAVTPALYPQLADHRIGDRVVLPMALVVEWLAQLLRVLEPDSSRLRLNHLQVLRPVVLADLGAGVTQLTLHYRRDPESRTVRVRLFGPDGAPCYGGAIVLPLDARAAERPPSAVDGASSFKANVTAATPRARVYDDDPLFHGPRFQALLGVDGVSATSARARIATTAAMGWPGAFLTEPVLVDAALQLALVWAFEATGQRYLPMRFGAFDVALGAQPATVVTGTLEAPPMSGAILRASVRVVDDLGAVLVDIRDVEGHPTPVRQSTALRITVAGDVDS